MKSLSTKLPKLNTKRVVLVAVGVLLLLALVIVVWSNLAWGRYVSDSDSRYEDTTSGIKTRLAGIESVSGVESIHEQATTAADELCYASVLPGLRIRFIDEAGQYQQQCQDRRTSLRAVADRAQRLKDRLTTERQVADILQKTGDDLKKTKDGDYSAQQKLWRQSLEELSSITPDDSYTDTMKAQQDAIESVIKRYDSLIKADETEKRTSFDDAVVELREAYSELEATGDQSVESYRQLTTDLYDVIGNL